MVQGSPAFKLPSLGQNHAAFGSRFGKKQKSAIRLHLAASFWQYTSLGMVFLEELDFLAEDHSKHGPLSDVTLTLRLATHRLH